MALECPFEFDNEYSGNLMFVNQDVYRSLSVLSEMLVDLDSEMNSISNRRCKDDDARLLERKMQQKSVLLEGKALLREKLYRLGSLPNELILQITGWVHVGYAISLCMCNKELNEKMKFVLGDAIGAKSQNGTTSYVLLSVNNISFDVKRSDHKPDARHVGRPVKLLENTKDKRCSICKKKGHESRKCWFREKNGKYCEFCNKRGHVSRECRSDTKEKNYCGFCSVHGHGSSECPNRR